MRDHSTVQRLLRDKLTSLEVVDVGVSLGLNRIKLSNLEKDKVLGEMISMWLRKDCDVLTKSGKPTINTLIKALKENKIGVDDIETEYGLKD